MRQSAERPAGRPDANALARAESEGKTPGRVRLTRWRIGRPKRYSAPLPLEVFKGGNPTSGQQEPLRARFSRDQNDGLRAVSGILLVGSSSATDAFVVIAMTRRSQVAIVVLLLGVACGVAIAVVYIRLSLPSPTIGDIAADLGALRPTPGRLTLIPAYGPVQTLRSVSTAGTDRSSTALHALRRLAASADRSPVMQQESATLDLLLGRPDEAVQDLEEATHRHSWAAPLWSDLAMAYLARSEAGDRPFDPFLALAAADRAWRLDARSPEAGFNRAVILQSLGLRGPAEEAWRTFVSLEPSGSGWRAEAGAALAELARPTLAETWSDNAVRLTAAALAGQPGAAESLVDASASGAETRALRSLVLPAAAKLAAGENTDGAAYLGAAAAIGSVLAYRHRDHYLTDVVADIEARLTEPLRPRLAALLRGLDHFAQGMVAVDRQDYGAGGLRFAEAETALAAARSPLAGLATYDRAVCDYYRPEPDYEGSRRALVALVDGTDPDRYPGLVARALWQIGVIDLERAAGVEPLSLYRQVVALYERMADPERKAEALSVLATAYDELGLADEAWRLYAEALATLPRMTGSRRAVSQLGTIGAALASAGEPAAALPFHDEAVRIAVERGTALEQAVALHYRSRARSGACDAVGAAADLAEAWRAWSRLPVGLQERLAPEIYHSEGELPPGEDPGVVIESQSRALAYFETTGKTVFVADAYAARGRAHLSAGDDERAEADLRAALSAQEERWAKLTADDLRISFLTPPRRQRVTADLVALLAGRRRRPDLAFMAAEQGRARALLDRLEPALRRSVPNAEEVAAELPAATAMVFYSVLDERLLVWVLGPDGVVYRALSVAAGELADEVAVLRAAGEDGDETAFRLSAARLYDLTVRPALAEVGDVDHLVFIPDRALHLVPFAALLDSSDGGFLLERFRVVAAPSVRVYLRALARSREAAPGGPRSVLAVGDPRYDRRLFPGLGPLGSTRREATDVSRLYPRGDLLLGERADPSTFVASAGAYEVLHLATHALANAETAKSALLLAAAPDDPQGGALYSHQITDLDLPHTRLAVLAACDTGTGPISGGEGAVSLARAFLAAGVPTVVQSLWKVEDEATAELMRILHARLAAGHDPITALREAQLAMLGHSDRRFRSPRAWAAFTVVGGAEPGAGGSSE